MSRTRKTPRKTWRRLHPSPVAIALDGSVFSNVGLYDGVHDAESTIRTAVKHGGRVFVGVELREDEVAKLKKWLDEASFECLAFTIGAEPRGRQRHEARSRKRSSDD